MGSGKVERWARRVAILMAFLGCAGLVWSTNVWLRYQRTLPRSADAASGRVYAVNVQNIVVYQTRGERDWLIGIEYAPFVLIGVSGLIGVMLFIRRKRGGRARPVMGDPEG